MNISDLQDITFGNLPVQTITLGNLTIWSRGGGDVHISISPTSLSLTSAYSSNIITVTSDDDTWYCETNVSWMTASRTSSTTARVTVYGNTQSTQSRDGVVRFMVDDVTYKTLPVHQTGAAVQPFPSGWETISEDGDWALAYRQSMTNYYTFAIIYRYDTTPPPGEVQATWDFDFTWEDAGDEVNDNLNDSMAIDGDTFDYAGHEYYGIELDELPNLDTDSISVNDFEVYDV
jgi:hypothetical protein